MVARFQSALGLVSTSTLPAADPINQAKERTRNDAGVRLHIVAATAAVMIGSAALLPLWIHMHTVWSSDSLRSMGAWFPLISLVGTLAAWRRLGWDLRGSLWGVVPIFLSIPLSRFLLMENPKLSLHGFDLTLAQFGPVLFLYGAGAVVLFGGKRLLRAALAPLCLLLCLNPVPFLYNRLVDLPLQQFSAGTARAFAHTIGLKPTGEQLRMMFAPNFGMMIVPGCDGVRGSITLAYLALIYGYTLRLRRATLAWITLLACLAGFALNLLRLCVLVVYYRLGLTFASVQNYGAQVDYGIGGVLFLFAGLALGLFIRSLAQKVPATAETTATAADFTPAVLRGVRLRACLLIALAVAFVAPEAHSLPQLLSPRLTEQAAYKLFPDHVGAFHLLRTYGEQQAGSLAFALADYEKPADALHPASRLTLGFWLKAPNHLVSLSKRAQGLYPEWVGTFDALSPTQTKEHFVGTFFEEGQLLQENAETSCSETSCAIEVSGRDGVHLQHAAGARDYLMPGLNKQLPILLRREWPVGGFTNVTQLRSTFEQDVQQFMSELDLQPIIRIAGSEL